MSAEQTQKPAAKKPVLYQLGDVTPANLQQLIQLNISTLPVRYTQKFYKELIPNYGTEYLKYAIWNGFVVGAVAARLEPIETDPQFNKLYIMTINVLAPYRRRGIATTLLNFVTEKAQKDTTIREIYLNVQTSNLDAKAFYVSHGFIEVEVMKDYYRNIDPPDAFLLRKEITHTKEAIAAAKNSAAAAGAVESVNKDVVPTEPVVA